MGTEITGDFGKSFGGSDRKPRKVGRDTNTADTGTETGERTGAGERTGTGEGTETSKESEGAGLLVIEEKKKKTREEKNAERRAKYAEKKAQEGGNVKPRKTTKKESVLKTDDVKMLLVTVFGILASRPDMEHWILSDAEADAIAQPLTKIISVTAFGSEMEKHGDAVVLAIACVTILLPRVVITLQKGKEHGKEHAKQLSTTAEESGKIETDIGKANETPATGSTGLSKNILSQYPVTA